MIYDEKRRLLEEVQRQLNQGDVLQAQMIIKDAIKNGNSTKELAIMYEVIGVFMAEVTFEEKITIFDYSCDTEELIKHYVRLKLLVRRLEYDMPYEKQKELYVYCKETGVSVQFITYIIENNLFDKHKVYRGIVKIWEEAEGKSSADAGVFKSKI